MPRCSTTCLRKIPIALETLESAFARDIRRLGWAIGSANCNPATFADLGRTFSSRLVSASWNRSGAT
jgi:hypothetical protein